jgi:hypothetical protein
MKSRVMVVLVLLLGVLAGCRQAPLDPGFAPPALDRAAPPTPAEVRYSVPIDFVETYEYVPGYQYFPAPALTFLIPADAVGEFDNLEVISVISSLMDLDVSQWSEEQVVELVQRMVARLGSPVAEPVRTTVAGHPAYTLPVKEQSANGTTTTYQATFIVEGNYLVQIQCQYEERQELIERACAELHESLEISID